MKKEFELLFPLNDSNFKSSLQYIALLALPTELDFWDDVGLNPAHTNKAPTNQMGNMCIYLTLAFFGILHKLICLLSFGKEKSWLQEVPYQIEPLQYQMV